MSKLVEFTITGDMILEDGESIEDDINHIERMINSKTDLNNIKIEHTIKEEN